MDRKATVCLPPWDAGGRITPGAASTSEKPHCVSMSGEFWGFPLLQGCPIPGPPIPKHPTLTPGESRVPPHPWRQLMRGAPLGAHSSTHGSPSQGWALGREAAPSGAGGGEDAGRGFCRTGRCSAPVPGKANCKAAAAKKPVLQLLLRLFREQTHSRRIAPSPGRGEGPPGSSPSGDTLSSLSLMARGPSAPGRNSPRRSAPRAGATGASRELIKNLTTPSPFRSEPRRINHRAETCNSRSESPQRTTYTRASRRVTLTMASRSATSFQLPPINGFTLGIFYQAKSCFIFARGWLRVP